VWGHVEICSSSSGSPPAPHKTSDQIFWESGEAEPELITHINPLFFSRRGAEEGNGSFHSQFHLFN